MTEKATTLSTQALWAKLFEAPTIDSFLSEADGSALPAFADYISDLAETKGVRPETVIRQGNLESSFGHRLFAGTRNPSRDTVLQLAFGFGLTSDETQLLMKVARVTALHPKVPRDAVIAYGLHHQLTLIETQQLLHESGLPLIGGGKRA